MSTFTNDVTTDTSSRLTELKDKGNAALIKKDYALARKFYSQGIALDAANHLLLSNRSHALILMGFYEEALEDAKACVACAPIGWLRAFFRLAKAYEKLGNIQKAIEAYDKGLEVDSMNVELQENRHRVLLNPDTTRIILLPSAKSVSGISAEMIGTVNIILRVVKFNKDTFKTTIEIPCPTGPCIQLLYPDHVNPVGNDRDIILDWTVTDTICKNGGSSKSLCLREMILDPRDALGSVDRCDQLLLNLAERLSTQGGLPSFLCHQHHRMDRSSMQVLFMQNVSNHSIYFFMLDCIAHSLILEVYGTRARLFQSHVISCPVVGYTATEWLDNTSSSSSSSSSSSNPVKAEARRRLAAQPYFLQARDKWGAGKELPYPMFRELIALIFNLQDYAEALADYLFRSCLPKKLQVQEQRWWEAAEAAAEASAAAGRPGPVGMSPLLAWTRAVIDHPAYPATITMTSCSVDDPMDFAAGLQVFNNGTFPNSVDFRFDIPAAVQKPFAVAYRELTGCYPAPYVYIVLLNMFNWKRNCIPDERVPGGSQVRGWTCFAASVPAPSAKPRLVLK